MESGSEEFERRGEQPGTPARRTGAGQKESERGKRGGEPAGVVSMWLTREGEVVRDERKIGKAQAQKRKALTFSPRWR